MHFQKIIDMNQTRSLLGSLIYQQQHCSQQPQCITLLERVNDSVLQIQNSWLLTLPAGGMNTEYLAQGPSSCSGACPVAWDIRTYCTTWLKALSCSQGLSFGSGYMDTKLGSRLFNLQQGLSQGLGYKDIELHSRPFKLQPGLLVAWDTVYGQNTWLKALQAAENTNIDSNTVTFLLQAYRNIFTKGLSCRAGGTLHRHRLVYRATQQATLFTLSCRAGGSSPLQQALLQSQLKQSTLQSSNAGSTGEPADLHTVICTQQLTSWAKG